MTYKTEIFKNHIPLDILKECATLAEKNIAETSNSVWSVHGTYYPVLNTIREMLQPFLLLLPNEVPIIQYLIHSRPTGVHTDSNLDGHSDPTTFARTFIIPVETQDTITITFKEHLPKGVYGNSVPEFLKNLPASKTIDQQFIENELSYDLDNVRSFYDKLNIETVFKWNAGDMLVFDRSRLHTGDNHLKKNISKKGFIIWSFMC